jgi:hypothetical protein
MMGNQNQPGLAPRGVYRTVAKRLENQFGSLTICEIIAHLG